MLAAPTSAIAASLPGQMTSSAAERPGSVSAPAARNAPRQMAASSSRAAGGEPVRQPADRPAPRIEQAGLAGQGLAALEHADEVDRRAARAGCRDHRQLRVHAVQLGDVARDPLGEHLGVELGLDRDAVRDDVQSPGEPQDRRQLRRPHRGAPRLRPWSVRPSPRRSVPTAITSRATRLIRGPDRDASRSRRHREVLAAGRPVPRRSRRSGACLPCTLSRSWRGACSPAGSPRTPVSCAFA